MERFKTGIQTVWDWFNSIGSACTHKRTHIHSKEGRGGGLGVCSGGLLNVCVCMCAAKDQVCVGMSVCVVVISV